MRRDFLSKSHRSDLNRGPTLYESVALSYGGGSSRTATWGGFIVAEIGDGKPNSGCGGESLDNRFGIRTMPFGGQ